MGLEKLDLEPPRSRDKVPGVRALTSARLCQPLSVTRQGAWQTCSKRCVSLSEPGAVTSEETMAGQGQWRIQPSPLIIRNRERHRTRRAHTPPFRSTYTYRVVEVEDSSRRHSTDIFPRRPREGRCRIPAGGTTTIGRRSLLPHRPAHLANHGLTSRAISRFQDSLHHLYPVR